MSASLKVNLPGVLKSVPTRPLFVMRLDVRKMLIIGATPGGVRRIGVVPGGSFEGDRLSGEVLGGGRGSSASSGLAERRLARISATLLESRRRDRNGERETSPRL